MHWIPQMRLFLEHIRKARQIDQIDQMRFRKRRKSFSPCGTSSQRAGPVSKRVHTCEPLRAACGPSGVLVTQNQPLGRFSCSGRARGVFKKVKAWCRKPTPALLARPCNVAKAVPRSAIPRRSARDPRHWISQMCVFLQHLRKARRIDPIDPKRSKKRRRSFCPLEAAILPARARVQPSRDPCWGDLNPEGLQRPGGSGP